MVKVLVVDDDPAMREVLKIRLETWGHEVRVAEDGVAGERIAGSWGPDVVVSDLVMPGLTGLELLRALKGGDPERPVILVTAHGEVDTAVEAMKQGATDFVTKPIDYVHLQALLEDLENKAKLRARARRMMSKAQKGGDFGPFVGRSKVMQRVYGLIEEVAANDASVLITGPSGTGKELVARTIHDLSARAGGPFLALNAAAIPSELIESEIFGHEKGSFTGATNSRKGCIELADQGTLFFDEIGEMPIKLQPKLLRVLEDGRVRRVGGREEMQFDVRVLAATNRDPRDAIEKGDLREDLFFRLNVFTIELPPLRERKGDIPTLVHFFISLFNERHGTAVEGVSEDVDRLLGTYLWPGNVRELRNVIERATVLAKEGWIESNHLPPFLKQTSEREDMQVVLSAGTPLAEAEKRLILKTLELTGENKAETARRLGVDVKTIRNKLREYGLS
ncbi:MAG: sigma-54 dependent transcriptional regulator [Acidobacteriota bacterium]